MPSTLKHAYMNDISDLYSELSCVRDLSMPMGVTVIRVVNKIRGFGRGEGRYLRDGKVHTQTVHVVQLCVF